MQITGLAAVHATEERLIAPRYMIQISVQLAFFTPNVNRLVRRALVIVYWMHLRVNLICISHFSKKNTTRNLEQSPTWVRPAP